MGLVGDDSETPLFQTALFADGLQNDREGLQRHHNDGALLLQLFLELGGLYLVRCIQRTVPEACEN